MHVARFTTHESNPSCSKLFVVGCKKLLQKVESSTTFSHKICTYWAFYRPKVNSYTAEIACSRRSDSRVPEKIHVETNKQTNNEGRTPHFPGVQFNSLPTDRRALLSEHLETAASDVTPVYGITPARVILTNQM